MEKDNRINGIFLSPEDPRDYRLRDVINGSKPVCLTQQAGERLYEALPAYYRIPGFDKDINHFDQGDSGMCGACAAAYTRHAREKKQTLFANKFSPAYIYAHRSGIEDTTEGMYIRDIFSILQKYGCCSWKNFPGFGTYKKIRKIYKKYAAKLDPIAAKYKIDSYYAINVDDTEEIKRAVYALNAVIISVPCYENCGPDWTEEEVKENGKWVPMAWPQVSEYDPEHCGELRGYHAMTITGWTSKGWVVENSWGGDWGKHGAAVLPYDYPIMEAWTGIDTIKTKASLFQLNRKITNGE